MRAEVATKAPYTPPSDWRVRPLLRLPLPGSRPVEREQQQRLIFGKSAASDEGPLLNTAGDVDLLSRPVVAVIGTRKVSKAGALRARRVAIELAQAGVVVMSGLAAGVDTHALQGAVDAGGRVIAVIGTPLDTAYPKQNAALQEQIYLHHLLISPFEVGRPVRRSNFPHRNKVMAALSDATVIVEASETSGTIHQAAECQRLGRWLFIMKSMAEDKDLTWPKSFLTKYDKASTLNSTEQILKVLFGDESLV